MAEKTNQNPVPPIVKPVITAETPAAILQAVEQVNAGVSDAPLVDLTPVAKTAVVMCPNHPKTQAIVYGMCVACYDKLPKVQKRRLYLDARLHGPNTHNYPSEFLAVWKREIVLIDAGLWKGPLKTKAKSKLAEEIMG